MCKYMYVYIEQIFPKSIHWERLGRGNIPKQGAHLAVGS